jgi:hypothetical protein
MLLEKVKSLSHRVAESHNNRGFSLVKVTETETSGGVLVNVSREPLVVQGQALKAKADVRRFLWDMRKTAALRRKDRVWVWSRWMEEEGVSLVGLATMTDRKVAERLAGIDQNYQFIEVGQ